MGLFDELKNVMMQTQEEIGKYGLDQSVKELEQGLNKAGTDVDRNLKSQSPRQTIPAGGARQSHPGYAKIAAWVKRRCGSKILGISDPSGKNFELEQITTEACSGMSLKARKGFLDYLKSQNYEQLLK